MKIFTLVFALFTLNALADLHFAPQKFQLKNKQIIFSDFKDVDALVIYDLDNAKAKANSTVRFETLENGYVAFDIKSQILSASIDGNKVAITQISSPDGETYYQLIEKELAAGTHELIIENTIDTNVSFNATGVKSAFWMSDLSDRKYLEQYLPTNLEYDHYQMDLEVKVMGNGQVEEHQIYTNGNIQNLSATHFKISFPDYFTASSFYFHLVPKGSFYQADFTYNSISGAVIPVVVYSRDQSSVANAKADSLKVLAELENKLGAWSHPSLTIYVAGLGGMEHAGATMTSLSALGHEVTHSFFARGVMPADGNSGWMDEAIASWRDGGYKAVRAPNFRSTSMSGHSQYSRTTDRKAYNQGANFMAYLNHKLQNQGGLETFLNKMHGLYTHSSITTKIFKKELELYSGENYTADFNRYIYGLKNKEIFTKEMVEDNPYHPKLTKQQLMDLL